jgi:heme-degrading monooxygenase HmoA
MMSNEQRATHARVIRFKTEPANSDTATKQWTSEILPLLKKQDGFRGATLVGNRKTGDGLSVTYWASEVAMKNVRPKVRPQAETIMSNAGSKIVDEDECEVAVQERIQPPKAGVFVRVTTVETDPAKADEGIAFYEEMILPVIASSPAHAPPCCS